MGAGSRLVRRRLEVGFLLLAIGSVVGTVQHWSQARDDRAFDQRGKAARALPETHLPASTRVGDEIALSYVAPDDKVVVAKPLKLNQERLDILRGGGRLDIVYLPDSPRTIRYAGWEPDFVPLWTGPLFAVLGAIGFAVLARRSRAKGGV